MDDTQKELLRWMLVFGDMRGDRVHQATLDGLAAHDLCLREIPDGLLSMPTYRLTDKGKLVASLLV